MRWLAWGQVLNEERYCAQSILSILDFVDELHLTEGAVGYAYWAGPYGLSSDRTAEIIRDLPGYGKKLFLHRVGWLPTKRQLRNMSLCMATRANPSWPNHHGSDTCALILDLDEVWDPADLQAADEAFSKDPTLQYIHCDLIQLRGDFEHYRDMTEGMQEHDLYNEQARKEEIACRNGVTLRQGRTAERLFRLQPNMHYVSHVCISDSYGRYLYTDPAYLGGREARMDIKFWHYNYLKPFPETFTKFCYFAQQDGGKKRNDEEMVDRALNEGYIKYLFTGTHPKGAWPVAPLPPHLTHPAIMGAHPDRHKTEREIADPTGEWLVPGAPDAPGYREKIMAMLRDGSKYVGPDLSKLVV